MHQAAHTTRTHLAVILAQLIFGAQTGRILGRSSHKIVMEGDAIMLSEKSRSLRRTSVKKRLETELKKDKSLKRLKREKHAKKPRLNKYQRRVANAKERERMKRMNEVFERLKKVVPMEQLNAEDGKDKKVVSIYHF